MNKKIYSMVVALFVMMLCSVTAMATTTIKFDHLTIKAGETVDVDLLLDNDVDVQSLEYTFKLPAGLSATKIVRNNDRLDRDEHEATLDLQSEELDKTGKIVLSRTYKISVFSKNGENIIGNEGAICTVTFVADKDFSGEQLNIKCVSATLSDPNGNSIWNSHPDVLINDILANVTAEPTALSFTKNSNATVKVAVQSNMEVYGLNATVVLPKGLSFVTKKNGKVDFTYSERMGDNLSIVQNLKEDGSLSIVINGDEPLVGLEGEVFSFDVTADVEVLAENSAIVINNIAATNFATNTNKSDDITIVVTNASIAITNAAVADMEWYENLCAELTAKMAGNEEYITADTRQAIEAFMGEYYPSAIQAALEDALENGTEYVCPFDKEMVEGQVRSWIAEIEGIKNGTVALYTEAGVVGDATLNSNMPFFATPVAVEVYSNKVVLKGWDGTEGSDLSIAFNKVAQNDDVTLAISGIEQTVNGEVVSELNDEGEDTYVVLYPQNDVYPMVAVEVANELTGIMLEDGMGQVSLFGHFQPASNVGGDDDNMGVADPVTAAYIVTWPGQPIVNAVVWNNIKAQIANVEEAIANYDATVATMMYASRYEGEELSELMDPARTWVAETTEAYKAKFEAGELTLEDGVMGEMMEQMGNVMQALNIAAKYDAGRYTFAVINYWYGNEDEEIEGVKDSVMAIVETLPEAGQSALLEQITLLEASIQEMLESYDVYTLYNEDTHATFVELHEALMASINDIVAAADQAAADQKEETERVAANNAAAEADYLLAETLQEEFTEAFKDLMEYVEENEEYLAIGNELAGLKDKIDEALAAVEAEGVYTSVVDADAIRARISALVQKIKGDIATGIYNATVGNDMEQIYNLKGQKVDSNFKGIVIKNGKKVMVK